MPISNEVLELLGSDNEPYPEGAILWFPCQGLLYKGIQPGHTGRISFVRNGTQIVLQTLRLLIKLKPLFQLVKFSILSHTLFVQVAKQSGKIHNLVEIEICV